MTCHWVAKVLHCTNPNSSGPWTVDLSIIFGVLAVTLVACRIFVWWVNR